MKYWLAPAKLNLFLHVVGRRGDGYHELQTLFQFIDFADELSFAIKPGTEIRRVACNRSLPDDDLTVRAATMLQKRYGVRQGVDISLRKNIPLGAGLGGGSSNAATTLLALNELWSLHLPITELQKIALALGADVPFFVFGHTAWAEGIGEKLTRVEVPESEYCVIIPPIEVSTARIFNHPQLTRNEPRITIRDFLAGGAAGGAGKSTGNSLEAVTSRLYPEVKQALNFAREYGHARMSGSGSAVFVPVAGKTAAETIFNAAPETWQVVYTRSLNRHSLRANAA